MTHQAALKIFAGAVFAVMILPGCSTPGSQGGGSPQTSEPGSASATAASPTAGSASPRSTTVADGKLTVAISGEINYKIERDAVEVTVLCTGGGDVNVDSTNARVVMKGDCRKLEMDGDVNTVTAEQIAEIRIDGDTNTVNADTVDEVEIKGTANTVVLGTVNDIRLEGRDNTLSYRDGNPASEDKGSNNSVTSN